MAFPSRAEGPWGAPALRAVRERLTAGWPPGLTVLTGDDLYHLDRAQEAILGALCPDRTDLYQWSVFGDTPVSAQALVGAARSMGMFAARRVVFLRDVASLEGEAEPLAAYAAAPPAGSFLLVRAPKLDRKRKLHKTLAEAGRLLTFRSPESDAEIAELSRVVSGLAKERGCALTPEAAGLLVAVCGSDVARIALELDKAASWLGGEGLSRPVSAEAIRELLAGAALLTGWELADALLARDRAAALQAARALADAGEEPIRVVGGLAYRVRALVQAKALAARGARGEEIVRAVRGAWFFRDALQAGMARYTLAEALAMPGRLLAADRAFKSRSIGKGAVLEVLVSELTAPASGGPR
jgi:DNA polymerase-3 subunit delta